MYPWAPPLHQAICSTGRTARPRGSGRVPGRRRCAWPIVGGHGRCQAPAPQDTVAQGRSRRLGGTPGPPPVGGCCPVPGGRPAAGDRPGAPTRHGSGPERAGPSCRPGAGPRRAGTSRGGPERRPRPRQRPHRAGRRWRSPRWPGAAPACPPRPGCRWAIVLESGGPGGRRSRRQWRADRSWGCLGAVGVGFPGHGASPGALSGRRS